MKFAIIPILTFLNNPKDLDPSYKTDLDLWDYFGRKKLRLIIEEIRYNNLLLCVWLCGGNKYCSVIKLGDYINQLVFVIISFINIT